jgi:hypothetical protein
LWLACTPVTKSKSRPQKKLLEFKNINFNASPGGSFSKASLPFEKSELAENILFNPKRSKIV